VPPPEQSYQVGWNPDGIYILANGSDFSERVYVVDTSVSGSAMEPVWSPDGTKIAFMCEADNWAGWEVCLVNRDGTDKRYVTTGTEWSGSPHWSPDGQSLFVASYREESTDIWQINLDESTWTKSFSPSTPGSHEHYPRLVEGYQQITFVSNPGSSLQAAYISNLDGSDLRLLESPVTVVDQTYYPWRTKTLTPSTPQPTPTPEPPKKEVSILGDEAEVPHDTSVVLVVAWFADTLEHEEDFLASLNVVLTLDGEPLTAPMDYWGAIEEYKDIDKDGDMDYVTSWLYPIGVLSQGTHLVECEWRFEWPITDGFDSDGDGALDGFYEPIEHSLEIEVE